MSRRRLTTTQLLARIRASADNETARSAEQLIHHAERLGLTPVGRHESVSLRLPLQGRKAESWLTLLVITTAGKIFAGWLDRWSRVPNGGALSIAYERNLRQLLGAEKVTLTRTIALSNLRNRLDDLLNLISKTTDDLSSARRAMSVAGLGPTVGSDIAALEGTLTETRQTRRGRSRRLRKEALRRAAGICAVCNNDFRGMLDGDGERVLQVHHREQLSALDAPRINSVDDLAVVCANCHLLIHMDPRNALSVTALRKMLEDDGRYALAPSRQNAI